MKIVYSFIVPVFNRPQEIKELLDSFLELQFDGIYEIVIIEDGSDETSKHIISNYSLQLPISYYHKENTGPGDSRNYGMRRAQGNYFIILDSDCILPVSYLKTVDEFLKKNYHHCYGGADKAHKSFSPIQKAINYVMTSFLTTGGIRGSKKSVNRFEPRSFNMGISKEAFELTRGFAKIHPGEDPDLSLRLLESGYETTFIPDAFVYHKRRISWIKFYQQVKKFGLVRPILNEWHPGTAKITFWFPTLFVLYVIGTVISMIFMHWILSMLLLIYIMVIVIDSAIKNKSIYIGLLSVLALFIQFFGYGMAFLKSTFLIRILKRAPQKQFPKLFFD